MELLCYTRGIVHHVDGVVVSKCLTDNHALFWVLLLLFAYLCLSSSRVYTSLIWDLLFGAHTNRTMCLVLFKRAAYDISFVASYGNYMGRRNSLGYCLLRIFCLGLIALNRISGRCSWGHSGKKQYILFPFFDTSHLGLDDG